MTLTQLFAQINSSYRGSDDNPPTTGDDYNLWLLTANRKQSEWARDGKNTWKSLFAIESLSPVVAVGTQTYNLPATVLLPSDKVTVTCLDGSIVDFTLVEPQERDQFQDSVYLSGNNPMTLTFATTIKTGDKIVGGTIKVAGYYQPADLALASDVIKVDDPYWLVYAVASELAFNDQTYDEKAADLNNKANNLYSQMVINNRRGSYNNPRTAKTNVNRILDPMSEAGY